MVAFPDQGRLVRMVPSTQVEYRGGGEIGRPQSRGFQADLLQNSRIDGYNVGAHFPQPVELYERQDVLYGLQAPSMAPPTPPVSSIAS